MNPGSLYVNTRHHRRLAILTDTLHSPRHPARRRRRRPAALLRRLGVVAVPVGARSARLHRFGETRALSVPAERHGRTARYGRASGTASGAIGRRLPGQPVAVAQSSWLRRVQQFECASDSRAAWGRPGDGHCLPVCTRHRARRRPPSGAAAGRDRLRRLEVPPSLYPLNWRGPKR